MATQIYLGDMPVDVEFKNIKNVHLSVHPPTGKVRISAPSRVSLDSLRAFAVTKLDWIRRQQDKLQAQERETPREYLERESHYLFGKRYLLNVFEEGPAPRIELAGNKILMYVRPGTGEASRQAILESWQRLQLRRAAQPVISRWEPLIGVEVRRLFVQRMKTKWGSCNARRQSIRLNTELAKKPRACLEYVVVHEMVHILEPSHNRHFYALMDQFMPQWQVRRELLNRLPVRYEQWDY